MRNLTGLRFLRLVDVAVRDLDPLKGLGLRALILMDVSPELTLDALAFLPELQDLSLYTQIPWDDLTQNPASEGLESLTLGDKSGCSLVGVSRWQQLRSVSLGVTLGPHEWRELAQLPLLEDLTITSGLDGAVPPAEVTSLYVLEPEQRFDFERTAEIFPKLADLRVYGPEWVPDLTPLSGIEGLRIDASGVMGVIGGHHFDPERLVAPGPSGSAAGSAE